MTITTMSIRVTSAASARLCRMYLSNRRYTGPNRMARTTAQRMAPWNGHHSKPSQPIENPLETAEYVKYNERTEPVMNFHRPLTRSLFLLVLALGLWLCCARGGFGATFLRSNDVICSIGGADVVSADEFGYLETYLRLSFPDLNLRFRGLGHEGDTVFSQPRDYNYPTIPKQLDQIGATIVLAHFGGLEGLEEKGTLVEFIDAYDQLLGKLGARRIVVVLPTRYERADPPLPDLSRKNDKLKAYVLAIKTLAAKRNLPFVDRFDAGTESQSRQRFTNDGLHLTALGHWHCDLITAGELGAGFAVAAARVNGRGEFFRRDWERIRQAVIAKNRLWFAYYRPTNWAFLGGDRTDQPSSRDHINPKIRWFPDEIKRFLPMIDQTENQIASLAAAGQGSLK